jgi:hypothetical protein
VWGREGGREALYSKPCSVRLGRRGMDERRWGRRRPGSRRYGSALGVALARARRGLGPRSLALTLAAVARGGAVAAAAAPAAINKTWWSESDSDQEREKMKTTFYIVVLPGTIYCGKLVDRKKDNCQGKKNPRCAALHFHVDTHPVVWLLTTTNIHLQCVIAFISDYIRYCYILINNGIEKHC